MPETLKSRLAREIALTGPMTVAEFVTRCLHDPRAGYYATRPALGEGGDFITAPLVSQMFGELIGLWAVETWRRLGAPERLRLVEVGPGDGTLMADALRAARVDPAFLEAVDLVLIEPSGPLRQVQARTLAEAEAHPRWVADLGRVETDAPVLLIANEVLDCLPARQFVRTAEAWTERCVTVDAAGDLIWNVVRQYPDYWARDRLARGLDGRRVDVGFRPDRLAGGLGRDGEVDAVGVVRLDVLDLVKIARKVRAVGRRGAIGGSGDGDTEPADCHSFSAFYIAWMDVAGDASGAAGNVFSRRSYRSTGPSTGGP
jgi:hypothetical protein